MKKILKLASYILATIIQVGLLSASFIVESLTRKKAGVNHHVIYKRVQYEKGIFSPSNLSIQSAVVAIIGIVLILLFLRAIKKKKSLFYKVQFLIGIGLSIAVLFVMNSNMFINKIAYPYFIIAFLSALLMQILIIGIISIVK